MAHQEKAKAFKTLDFYQSINDLEIWQRSNVLRASDIDSHSQDMIQRYVDNGFYFNRDCQRAAAIKFIDALADYDDDVMIYYRDSLQSLVDNDPLPHVVKALEKGKAKKLSDAKFFDDRWIEFKTEIGDVVPEYFIDALLKHAPNVARLHLEGNVYTPESYILLRKHARKVAAELRKVDIKGSDPLAVKARTFVEVFDRILQNLEQLKTHDEIATWFEEDFGETVDKVDEIKADFAKPKNPPPTAPEPAPVAQPEPVEYDPAFSDLHVKILTRNGLDPNEFLTPYHYPHPDYAYRTLADKLKKKARELNGPGAWTNQGDAAFLLDLGRDVLGGLADRKRDSKKAMIFIKALVDISFSDSLGSGLCFKDAWQHCLEKENLSEEELNLCSIICHAVSRQITLNTSDNDLLRFKAYQLDLAPRIQKEMAKLCRFSYDPTHKITDHPNGEYSLSKCIDDMFDAQERTMILNQMKKDRLSLQERSLVTRFMNEESLNRRTRRELLDTVILWGELSDEPEVVMKLYEKL